MPLKIGQFERERRQSEGLVRHYRAIGPAAVIAALLCAPRQRVRIGSALTKAA